MLEIIKACGFLANLPLSNETEDLPNPVSDEMVHFRLTDLCQKVLGEALDKTEQVSSHFLFSEKKIFFSFLLSKFLNIENCLDKQLGYASSSS